MSPFGRLFSFEINPVLSSSPPRTRARSSLVALHMGSKIKQLMQQWPTGQVATTRWLSSLGVDRRLASNEFSGSRLSIDLVELDVATPERAALEMMYLVPKRQSFEEACQVVEALTTLRPLFLQSLLESCTSVKTKRLFMHAAERANHAWLKHLDLSGVDFGSGRRTIHAGGRLDRKYDLIVADHTLGQPDP